MNNEKVKVLKELYHVEEYTYKFDEESAVKNFEDLTNAGYNFENGDGE